jgi:hypothetical protein
MCMILIVDMQLLQNIMKANEVQFPEPLMAELHPDCIDMCRKLLRPNPGTSALLGYKWSHVPAVVSTGILQ